MFRRAEYVFLLAAWTAACSGSGSLSHGGGAADEQVATAQAALVNPNRSANGLGPLQNFAHVQTLGLAGTIEAKSSVEDGVYNYTVPLNVPEGAGGLTPSLALHYSSRNENGPLGVGWSLDGLSSISHCPHNVANDGYAAGIDIGADRNAYVNQYCIDGNKLVPVSRVGNVITFQTERADFSRIRAFYATTSAGEPDYFLVDLPNGHTRSYGNAPGTDASSNVVAVDTSMPAVPQAWLLALENSPGRVITYTYERDLSGVTLPLFGVTTNPLATRYISTISYSNKTIRFVWEDRPDIVNKAAFGYVTSLRKRLQRVEIHSPASTDTGETTGSGSYSATALWQYVLDYAQSDYTNRSEIVGLRLYDKNLTPLVTTFRWNARQSDAEYAQPFQVNTYDLTHGNYRQALRNTGDMVVGDYNGDGADDVLYSTMPSATTNSPKLFLRLGSPSGLTPEIDVTSSVFPANAAFSLYLAFAADLEGDGKSELFLDSFTGVGDNGSPYRAFRFNGSNAFTEITTGSVATMLRGLRGWRWTNSVDATHPPDTWEDEPQNQRVPLIPLDANGDGMIDFLGGVSWPVPVAQGGLFSPYQPQSLRIFPALSRSAQFYDTCRPESAPHPSGAHCGFLSETNGPFALGDTDGDGVTNIVPVVDGGPLSYMKGQKGAAPVPLNSDGYWYTSDGMYGDNTTLRLQDANGDGVADVLDFSNGFGKGYCGPSTINLRIYANDGRWTNNPQNSSYSDNPFTFDMSSFSKQPCTEDHLGLYMKSLRYGDFNGDGIGDILLLNPGIGGPAFKLDTLAQLGSPTSRTNLVAYNVPPVLLLGTGTGYKQLTLPLGGPRMREITDRCWAPVSGSPGVFRTNVPACVTRGIGNDFAYAQTGDFNGDGITELAQFVLSPDGNTLKLETIGNQKVDRKDVMVEVRNGFLQGSNGANFSEQITYADLTTMTKDGAYACTALPRPANTICETRNMLLVRTLMPMGRNGVAPIRYGYADAVSDPRGRGFLGFGTVNVYDAVLNRLDKTYKHFTCSPLSIDATLGSAPNAPAAPRSGRACYVDNVDFTRYETALPKSELVTPSISIGVAGPLHWTERKTSNELVTALPNGTAQKPTGTFLVRPKHTDITEVYIPSAQSTYETKSTPDRQQTVDYVYDAYSNVDTVTRVTTGGVTDKLHTVYDNLTAQSTNLWSIGMPRRIEHTRSQGTEAAVTRISTRSYTNEGLLDTVTTEPEGSSDLKISTHYVRDYDILAGSRYNVLREETTDVDMVTGQPRKRTKTFTYDSQGINVTSVTNDLQMVTTYSYDPEFDALISVVDANGIGTDFLYDTFGRKRGTFRDGRQAEYDTYFPWDVGAQSKHYISIATGATCSTGQPLNGRCFINDRTTSFDQRGLTSSVTEVVQDGSIFNTSYNYDGSGQLSGVWHRQNTNAHTPPPHTSYVYDELNRLKSSESPSGTRSWQYPSWDRVDSTDENGVVTSHFDDKDRRLIRTEENLTSNLVSARKIQTEQFYDSFDNIKETRRTANGVVRSTTHTFDKRGRMSTSTDAVSGLRQTFYDASGDVWREKNELGSRTITRDILGRTIKNVDDANANDYETFTWDTATNGLGQLASSTRWPEDVRVSYGYASSGQAISTAVNTKDYRAPSMKRRILQLTQSVDSEGRPDLVSATGPNGALSGFQYRYYYNSYGFLQHVDAEGMIMPSLWSQTANPDQTHQYFGDFSAEDRSFDPGSDRVQNITVYAPPMTQQLLSYTYYPDGNVKTRGDSVSGVNETMSYDTLGRLQQWQRSSPTGTNTPINTVYHYDDFGGMTEAITYNALSGGTELKHDSYGLGFVVGSRTNPSAVATFASGRYSYDALGRRTAQRTPTTSTSYEYLLYNHFNLPTRLDTRVGAPGATPTSIVPHDEYWYDANGGRAVHAKIDTNDVTYYLGDFLELRNNPTAGADRYVYHVKVGNRIVAEVTQTLNGGTVNTSFQYPHQDGLGSTTLASASGAPAYYEPFGALLDSSGRNPGAGPGIRNDFTGHERDGGFINMKGRIYDPALRRFISPDPIVSGPTRSQGHEPYAYVMNSPFRYTDPTGYCAETRTGEPCLQKTPEGGYNVEFDDDHLNGTPPASSESSSQPDTGAPNGTERGSMDGPDPVESAPVSDDRHNANFDPSSYERGTSVNSELIQYTIPNERNADKLDRINAGGPLDSRAPVIQLGSVASVDYWPLAVLTVATSVPTGYEVAGGVYFDTGTMTGGFYRRSEFHVGPGAAIGMGQEFSVTAGRNAAAGNATAANVAGGFLGMFGLTGNQNFVGGSMSFGAGAVAGVAASNTELLDGHLEPVPNQPVLPVFIPSQMWVP